MVRRRVDDEDDFHKSVLGGTEIRRSFGVYMTSMLAGVGVHGEDGLCVCSLVTLVVLYVCVPPSKICVLGAPPSKICVC